MLKKLIFITLFLLVFSCTAYALTTPWWVNTGTKAVGITNTKVPLPVGWQETDIFVMFVETANESIDIPNGWTNVPTVSPQSLTYSGKSTKLYALLKRATSSEDKVSLTCSGCTSHVIAQIMAIRGCYMGGTVTDAVDASAGGTVTPATTSVSVTGATATVSNTLVIASVSNASDVSTLQASDTWTNANLTSITERADSNTIEGSGGGFSVAVGERVNTGSYGDSTTSLSTASIQTYISFNLKGIETTLNSIETFNCSGYCLGTGIPGWTENGNGIKDEDYMAASSTQQWLRICNCAAGGSGCSPTLDCTDVQNTNVPYVAYDKNSDTNDTYVTTDMFIRRFILNSDSTYKRLFAGYLKGTTTLAWAFDAYRNSSTDYYIRFAWYAGSNQTETSSYYLWNNSGHSAPYYDFRNNPIRFSVNYHYIDATHGHVDWDIRDAYGNIKVSNTHADQTGMRAGTGKWAVGTTNGSSASSDILFKNFSVNSTGYFYPGVVYADSGTTSCTSESSGNTSDNCATPKTKYTCGLRDTYEYGVTTNWNGSAYDDNTKSTNRDCGTTADARLTFPESYCDITTTTKCVSDDDCPVSETCVHNDFEQEYNAYPFEMTGDYAPSASTIETIIEWVHKNVTPARPVKIVNAMAYYDLTTAITHDGSYEGIQIAVGYRTGTGSSITGNTRNGIFVFIFPPYFDSTRTQPYPLYIGNNGTGYTPYRNLFGADANGVMLKYISESADGNTLLCTAYQRPFKCCTNNQTGTCNNGIIGVIGSLGGHKAQAFNTEWMDAFNDAIEYLASHFNADKWKIGAGGGSRGGGSSLMEAINPRGTGKQHSSDNNVAYYVDADGRDMSTLMSAGYHIKNISTGATGVIDHFTNGHATNDKICFNAGCNGGMSSGNWTSGNILNTYRIMGVYAGAPPTAMGDHSLAEITTWPNMQVYWPPYTGYLTCTPPCSSSEEINAFDTFDYSAAIPPHCKDVTHCDLATLAKTIIPDATGNAGTDDLTLANTYSPYGYLSTSDSANLYFGTDRDISLSIGTHDSIIPDYTSLKFDELLRARSIPHRVCYYVMGGHSAEYSQCISSESHGSAIKFIYDYLRCANRQSSACSFPTLPAVNAREYWLTDIKTSSDPGGEPHQGEDAVYYRSEVSGANILFSVNVPTYLTNSIINNGKNSPYQGLQQPNQISISGVKDQTWQIEILNASRTTLHTYSGTFGSSTYTYDGTPNQSCQRYGDEFCLMQNVAYSCSSPPCLRFYKMKYRDKYQDMSNTPYKATDPNEVCTSGSPPTPLTCCTGSGTGTCLGRELYTCVVANRCNNINGSATNGVSCSSDSDCTLGTYLYCMQPTEDQIQEGLSRSNRLTQDSDCNIWDGTSHLALGNGITSTLFCGDGFCDSPTETVENCSEDCAGGGRAIMGGIMRGVFK